MEKVSHGWGFIAEYGFAKSVDGINLFKLKDGDFGRKDSYVYFSYSQIVIRKVASLKS